MAAITLDTINVKSVYGVIAIRGSYNDLVRLPDLKEPSTYSWATQDGDDYDLRNRKAAARDISLTWLLSGTSAADMYSKMDALYAALKADGERTLYITSLGKSFTLYYKGCESAKFIRGSKFRTEMVLKFRLNSF